MNSTIFQDALMRRHKISGMGIIALSLCTLLSCTVGYAQGTWTTASTKGFTPRTYLCSAVVNGKIYTFGGLPNTSGGALATLEVFDPAANTWRTPVTTGTFTARSGLCASVFNGKIYVFGGIDSSINILNTLEVFDPSTNTWSTPVTTGTFTPRHRLVSAVVGGKIYLIGGSTGFSLASASNIVEVFDPVSNAWSTPTTTGGFTPRRGPAVTVIDDKIYIMGGNDAYPNFLNILEVFDPKTNVWSAPITAGELTARAGLGADTINGKIYAIGGYNGADFYDDIECFDPQTNTWSVPSFAGTFTGRSGVTATTINGSLYVIGGGNKSAMKGYNEVFTPITNVVKLKNSTEDIVLSPNPTNGIVNVYGAPKKMSAIIVANILGQAVMNLQNLHSSELTLDLSSLSPGTYFITFVSADALVRKAVVRE